MQNNLHSIELSDWSVYYNCCTSIIIIIPVSVSMMQFGSVMQHLLEQHILVPLLNKAKEFKNSFWILVKVSDTTDSLLYIGGGLYCMYLN